MAKKIRKPPKTREPDNPDEGEQLDLIDVTPEIAKQLKRLGRTYQRYKRERIAALTKEVEYKTKLLGALRDSKVPKQADGSIKCRLDGMKITVTPRDDLVRVFFDKDDGES